MEDSISRQAAIDLMCRALHHNYEEGYAVTQMLALPPAQPEDYAELKREFIRMAQYIDVLLYCPDEQKKTLNGFISRLAELMPYKKEEKDEHRL